MTTDQHKIEVQFMIESLTAELARLIIEEKHLSIKDALDIIYNSHTFEKLENEETGLYYQSAVYVLDMLKEELGDDLKPVLLKVAEEVA